MEIIKSGHSETDQSKNAARKIDEKLPQLFAQLRKQQKLEDQSVTLKNKDMRNL